MVRVVVVDDRDRSIDDSLGISRGSADGKPNGQGGRSYDGLHWDFPRVLVGCVSGSAPSMAAAGITHDESTASAARGVSPERCA